MSTAVHPPDNAMAWYRTAIWRAKMLTLRRWVPDYVSLQHVAIVLLDPLADDLAELLNSCGVDPVALRAELVRAEDEWLLGQGLALGYGSDTVGAGARHPRLKEALRSLCPDGDGCDRCVFSPADLFVALVRVPDSCFRTTLGDRAEIILTARPERIRRAEPDCLRATRSQGVAPAPLGPRHLHSAME